jgi:hypothetical protein
MDNKIKINFHSLIELEQEIESEFEAFVVDITGSEKNISREKIIIEHRICDFEDELNRYLDFSKNTKSHKKILFYKTIITKIRKQWNIVYD